MTDAIRWYPTVRAVLELLYFASGIGILVAALFGLKQVRVAAQQLKLTKEIADSNARRESVKYAANQCSYFAKEVMPAFEKIVAEYKEHNLRSLFPQQPQQRSFFPVDKDFAVTYDVKVLEV